MQSNLAGLRYRCGATEVELTAFELTNGCRCTDLDLIAEHNRLLEQHAESRRWLSAAEAEATGMQNFKPKAK